MTADSRTAVSRIQRYSCKHRVSLAGRVCLRPRAGLVSAIEVLWRWIGFRHYDSRFRCSSDPVWILDDAGTCNAGAATVGGQTVDGFRAKGNLRPLRSHGVDLFLKAPEPFSS
jgi:hypothetical protein